jgi:hypothetical protein
MGWRIIIQGWPLVKARPPSEKAKAKRIGGEFRWYSAVQEV